MDVSDLFYFFLLGEGDGGVRGARSGGGDWFFIENPWEGGGVPGGEGPRGREGGIGDFFFGRGGWLNFFFSGPKCPPSQARFS